MKNIIILLLFIITTFILNIIFYYNSNDYRNFLRGLKNNTEYNSTGNLDLSGVVENNSYKYNSGSLFDTGSIVSNELNELVEGKKAENNSKKDTQTEIKLGKNYQDVLNYFKGYDLELLQINTNLFDITNEYPDKYFEYYSRHITLYFFPTKNYSDILDIFEVLSMELPFTVNELNTFGDKSFYINLNSDIDDNIVRIVLEADNVLFGIKVKRSEYLKIKKILENFKN